MVGRFWTLVHWTNWRVVFPFPRWQQERVAREAMTELQGGRPVQLLVTNFPTWELNHTVVAYAYRLDPAGNVLFTVYDPNDPREPGRVTFDRPERRVRPSRPFPPQPRPLPGLLLELWGPPQADAPAPSPPRRLPPRPPPPLGVAPAQH